MPRLKQTIAPLDDEEFLGDVLDDDDVENDDDYEDIEAEATPPKRGRGAPRGPRGPRVPKPVPDGVTIGLAPLERRAPAGRTGRKGRQVSRATLDAIEQVVSQPGEWFFVGIFGSPAAPSEVWKAASIRFTHERRPDGLYDRYAICGEPSAE